MKKKVVISAINFFEGGPLSVYKDCLDSIIENKLNETYEITAFVHKKELFSEYSKEINLIELPNSRKGYLFRVWYEYIYFYIYSKNQNIEVWLSLHDITPNVKAKKRYVYCHNPSPFMETNIKKIKYSYKNFMFSIFYKYLYKINIKKNIAVIVQQDWMREEFKKMFKLENVIVARPSTNDNVVNIEKKYKRNKKTIFLYPAYPRFFKNFEVICEACRILEGKGIGEYVVLLTIDGTENKYSQDLKKKYTELSSVLFIGIQERKRLFELYDEIDCMIFPSKLETWGLPISEFKITKKPIILSDLPYAHETIGTYSKAVFFDVNNASELSDYMIKEIANDNVYTSVVEKDVQEPYANNWDKLLDLILN